MPQRSVRLVIAGGGTGGHVLPALAVLEELGRGDHAIEPLWIGSADGVEDDAAQRAGIPFRVIPTGKLRRYFSLQTPVDLVRVPVGILRARALLREFKPDVVFSTGGFVSVPTVIAATRLAPVLTHEQTAVLGLANRVNHRFADVLAVSYDATAKFVTRPSLRVVVTGNPVRASLGSGDAAKGFAAYDFDPDVPLLYVTGGARGASPLNRRIADLLPELLEHCQVLHQTGPASANSDAADLRRQAATWPAHLQRRYHVVEFVRDELADVYAAASLLLARAGAGTVAELAYVGKPAVLVPLPGAGGDEQTHNARLLADAGGAVHLPQSEATPQRLQEILVDLLTRSDQTRQMADRARAVGRRDAASRLAAELLALASSRAERSRN